MTFPANDMLATNDDFASRELSIEELEAVAAGSFLGWLKHEASSALHLIEGPGVRIATTFIALWDSRDKSTACRDHVRSVTAAARRSRHVVCVTGGPATFRRGENEDDFDP
jgi:hypothetical protein